MIFLMMRTDNPRAQLSLFENGSLIDEIIWEADRQLAESIHVQLSALLHRASYVFDDIAGIVVYAGPGSFTGLRIGFSVANALAYGLSVPVVSMAGDSWQHDGLVGIKEIPVGHYAQPNYGADANITLPRK